MAGSNRWFTYVSDDGTDWALYADESNVEGANGTAANAGAPENQLYKPPANLRLRFAIYSNAAGTRNLKVPILTQTVYDALTSASTIPDQIAGGGATLSLIRKRPEVISPIPTAFDSGINDGDNP